MDHDEKRTTIETLIENSPLTASLNDDIAKFYEEVPETPPEEDAFRKMRYMHALRKILNHYFDIHLLEVSAKDLQIDLQNIIYEIYSESGGLDDIESVRDVDVEGTQPDGDHYPTEKTLADDGLVEVFEDKLTMIKEDIGRADEVTYTIWFPWQIRWKNAPEQLQTYDLTLKPAESRSRSLGVLEQMINNHDIDGAREIRRRVAENDYDMWQTTVIAKSPRYAFITFKNALQLLSAQLNHAQYGSSPVTRTDRNSTFPGSADTDARWTAIQRPFGMYWEDDRVDEASRSADYGFRGAHVYNRGSVPTVEIDYEAISERYEWHSAHERGAKDERGIIHDALIEYQQGLTAAAHETAFFNFWRVIETLSLVEVQESKAEAIDRAQFALEVVTDGEQEPIIAEIATEIWERRNEWVHSPGWTQIEDRHERAAKVLADALIELHVSTLDHLSIDMRKQVLGWVTEPEQKREGTAKALSEIDGI